MAAESSAQQIASIADPSVPAFQPLVTAAQPQQPATVLQTTADVNGSNGSVDNGGIVDRCAWVLSDKQAAGYQGRAVTQFSALNMWSNENLGAPWYLPTVAGTSNAFKLMFLGAFAGGFHGYQRSHGKGFSTAGYALAGAFFPVLTLGVGLFQGYGKPRRGR